MKTFSFIFFISFSHFALMSQPNSMSAKEAQDLFTNHRYNTISSYYKEALHTDSLNCELNYKMGTCYFNSRSKKENSVVYLKQALAGKTLNDSLTVLTYKMLGEVYFTSSRFDEAITNYTEYVLTAGKLLNCTEDAYENTSQKIRICQLQNELKELNETLNNYRTHKCPNKIKTSNSPYTNYQAALGSKQLPSFSNTKKHAPVPIKSSDQNYFETVPLYPPTPISSMVKNTDTAKIHMETTVASSVDGQIILIYSNENSLGNLYTSRLKGNEWMQPEKVNRIITSKGWESDEYISTDGNTLYFSSDRNGGYGGSDIYKCTKLQCGDWAKAINLGPSINSPDDEEAPIIHPDRTTLYFSSNRYKVKSNFDNFKSTVSDSGTWMKPVLVGYPSHKVPQEQKKNNESENNNYTVTFANQAKFPLTLMSGFITDKHGAIPSYVEITVSNIETGEVSGVYNANSLTGRYTIILPANKNCNITFKSTGYLFHSEHTDISIEKIDYKTNDAIELSPISPGSKITLNNIFFNPDNSLLLQASGIELENILNVFLLNPRITVELSIDAENDSHNDSEFTSKKIQAVIGYLVGKGLPGESMISKINRKPGRKEKRSDSKNNNLPTNSKLELKIIAIK